MPALDFDTLALAIIFFVVAPLGFMSGSTRDTISMRGVLLLYCAALLFGGVALGSWVMLPAFRGSLAGALPAMVLILALYLGGCFLSCALIATAFVLTRDEAASALRRRRDAESREPRRPSLALPSRSENVTRIAIAIGSLSLVSALYVLKMVMSERVPNHLRLVGLYAGPRDPLLLSFAATPGPYVLQLLVFGLIALALGGFALLLYRDARSARL